MLGIDSQGRRNFEQEETGSGSTSTAQVQFDSSSEPPIADFPSAHAVHSDAPFANGLYLLAHRLLAGRCA